MLVNKPAASARKMHCLHTLHFHSIFISQPCPLAAEHITAAQALCLLDPHPRQPSPITACVALQVPCVVGRRQGQLDVHQQDGFLRAVFGSGLDAAAIAGSLFFGMVCEMTRQQDGPTRVLPGSALGTAAARRVPDSQECETTVICWFVRWRSN